MTYLKHIVLVALLGVTPALAETQDARAERMESQIQQLQQFVVSLQARLNLIGHSERLVGVPVDDNIAFVDRDSASSTRDVKVATTATNTAGYLGVAWNDGVLKINADGSATTIDGLAYTHADGVVTLAHGDTSTYSPGANSGGVVIQTLTTDDAGHILSEGTTDLDDRYSLDDHALTDHSDVYISGPALYHVLTYNGSGWVSGWVRAH